MLAETNGLLVAGQERRLQELFSGTGATKTTESSLIARAKQQAGWPWVFKAGEKSPAFSVCQYVIIK